MVSTTPEHRGAIGLPARRAWIDRLIEAYSTPPGSTGHIDPVDAAFLWDLVEATQAELVVELGTAAGVSSMLLAAALSGAVRDSGIRPAVHSYDLHPWCYFDRSKPVGFAVEMLRPDLIDRVAFHTRATAFDAGSAHRGLGLVFVDADHRHPAPALDVLALLPATRPGAWIALHDIRLPELAERHRARTGDRPDWADQTGPQRLFRAWPFEKIESEGSTAGDGGNTGAIRVPPDVHAARRAVVRIASEGPREVEPHPSVAALLDDVSQG